MYCTPYSVWHNYFVYGMAGGMIILPIPGWVHRHSDPGDSFPFDHHHHQHHLTTDFPSDIISS